MANQSAGRILRLQVKLVLATVVVTALAGAGHAALPVSALIGGLVAIVPAWVYARIAYARRFGPPAMLMRAHFKAEAAKFCLTVLLFCAVMAGLKDVSVVGLACGYFAAVSGYWFGLLVKN